MPNFAMPVRLYMRAPAHAVAAGDSLRRAHDELREHGVSSLAVTDPTGALVGVISRTDLLRVGRLQAGARGDAALLALPDTEVARAMTAPVVTVDADDAMSEAASRMLRGQIHRVFVTEGGALAGVLSTRDIAIAIRDKRMTNPISEFMSRPVFTIRVREPISLATDRLAKARVSGLVVVEDDWPVGVFTQREALASRDAARDTAVEEVMNPALICLPVDTGMHRAAAQMLALRARRVIACRQREMTGILSGLAFAQAIR